jgi:hypothetical protein
MLVKGLSEDALMSVLLRLIAVVVESMDGMRVGRGMKKSVCCCRKTMNFLRTEDQLRRL